MNNHARHAPAISAQRAGTWGGDEHPPAARRAGAPPCVLVLHPPPRPTPRDHAGVGVGWGALWYGSALRKGVESAGRGPWQGALAGGPGRGAWQGALAGGPWEGGPGRGGPGRGPWQGGPWQGGAGRGALAGGPGLPPDALVYTQARR